MNKIIFKIKKRLSWLEKEIKQLKAIKDYSSNAKSFIEGKIFAYSEEKRILCNLLELIREIKCQETD